MKNEFMFEVGVVNWEDKAEFEMLKKEYNYCGIVDLVAGINEWWTNEVNMIEIVKAVLENKSIQDLVNIPKCLS